MEEHTSHTFATEMTPLDQQSSHSFANELTSDDFQHNNNNNNNVPKRKAKSISPATNKKESVEPPARTRSHVDIFQSHFVVASGGGSGHGSGSGHGGKKYRSSPKSARKRPVMEPEGTKAHDTNDEGEFRPSVKPTVSAVSSDSASAATSTSLPQPWKELLKTTKQRAQSMGDVVSSNNNYNHNHASYDFSAGTPSEDLASTESLELEPSPTSVVEESPTKGVFSLDFTNQQQDVEPHVLTKQQKQQGTSDVQAYHESIQWKSLAVPHPLQSSGRRAQRRMTLTCDGRDNLDRGTNTDRRAKTVAPPGNDGNILSPRGAASRDSDVDAERQKLISPAASNDDASEADLDLSDMVLTQAESEIEAAQLPSVTTIVQHLSASASLIDATDIPYKTTLNSFAAERSVDTDDETLLTRSESGEEDSANNELPKQGSAITQHFASTTKSKKSLSDACDSVVLSKALKVVPSLHSSEVDDTDNQTALPSLHSIQQNEVEEDSVVSELPTATTISQHLAAKSPRSQRKGISDACDSVVLSKALQKKPLSKSLQPDDVDNDTVLPSLYSIQESQAGTVSTESLAEERTRTTATESTTISQHLSSTSPKKSKKVLSDACDSVVLSKTLQNRPLGRVMQRDEPDNDTVLPSLYSVQPSGTEDEEEDEENSVLTELPTASSISQHISATSTGKFRKKGLSDACDSVVLSKALKNKPLGRAFQPDEIDNDTVLPSLYSIQQSDPDDEDDDESDESMVSELPKNARLKQHFAAKSAKHRNKKGLSDACDSVVLSKALKTKPLTRTLHPDEQDNDTVLPSLYSVQPSDTDDSDEDEGDESVVSELPKNTRLNQHLKTKPLTRTLHPAEQDNDTVLPSLYSVQPSDTEDSGEDEGDESVVSELPKNTRLKQHFAAKSPKQRNKKGLSDACDSVVLSKALQKKPLMKSIQAEEYDNDTVLPSLYSVETREVDEGGSVASSYVLEPTRKGHTSNSLLNASGKFRALEERKGQAITNAYAMDDLMMNTSTLLKDDSGAGDKDGSIRRRSLDVLSSYNKASSYSGNKANLSALDLSPQKPKKTLSYQSHFSNAAPPLTGTDQTRSANLDEDDEIVSVDGSLEDHGEGAPSPIRRYHSMQPGSSAHRRNDLWLYKNNGNNNDERKVTRRHSYGTSTGHSRATLESLDNSESVVGELPERGKLQLVKSSDSVELTFVRKKKSAQKSAQQKRQRSARRLKPWTSTSNLDASMDLNFLHQSVPTHGPSPWEHFTSGGENAEEDHLTRSQRLDRWSTSY
ncbi:expressed unknown protein [Seminavis robusta]|uniref:Uncharacterized protein n=1 Tax=Seminavis robusta TaxID=568900 RepID=A0A9N8HSL3_9STRA|nr:expressed unknown protein [Seminavis robusta]|eukprot:Sro1458_g274470.1 n/a (1275) ;mRNA; r:24889-28713